MSTLLTPSFPASSFIALGAPTVATLLEHLGGISADRVRYSPMPGTATEQDVIDVEAREGRLCELFDGVLVEKPMGFGESYLASLIGTFINEFVRARKLGVVLGADATIKVSPGQVRIPDVAYFSYQRLPDGRIPKEAIPQLAPDLAVEVLSESNTPREMQRKLREYFAAGAQLVWFVDQRKRSVDVYTAVDQCVTLTEEQQLDGGSVLPGFSIELQTLFAELTE